MNNPASHNFDVIANAVSDYLRPLGYKKGRNTFRLVMAETTAVVQVQRSIGSTKERILFTINLGVVINELLRQRGRSGTTPEKAGMMDVHVRMRLGHLLPTPHDKWWEVAETTDKNPLIAEIGTLLTMYGVPFLSRYLTRQAIVSDWQLGISHGLTSVQAQSFLKQLNVTS